MNETFVDQSSHQKTALDFMSQRENGPIPEEYQLWKPHEREGQSCYRHAVTGTISGGILADEMGMGKSLSMLALILRTLDMAYTWATETSASSHDAPDNWLPNSRSKATLIVASSDLMINEWFQELGKHFGTASNHMLKTFKYHGQKRRCSVESLRNADLVITTYHTLASDYSNAKGLLNQVEWYRLVLDEERAQYNQTQKIMMRAVKNQAESFDNHSTLSMFQIQLQLRILCNHGTWQQLFSWSRRKLYLLDEREAKDADVGSEEDLYFRAEGKSSKMEALMSDVMKDIEITKSIIFTCWTRTLDLIQLYLSRENLTARNVKRIDGDCPTAKREKILEEFEHSADLHVLIMTTGTGAVGFVVSYAVSRLHLLTTMRSLNLAVANRVFIVEPQWNPSVENQAVARALRLGQKQAVLVTRYVVETSVEQVWRRSDAE
ncbi:hypothetical protein SLS61_005861 [Didymella pomorum]